MMARPFGAIAPGQRRRAAAPACHGLGAPRGVGCEVLLRVLIRDDTQHVATLRGARGAPGPTTERALRTKWIADLGAVVTPHPTAPAAPASSRRVGAADGK